MTRVLEKAFAEVAKLPAEEQDRIGRWLLVELSDDVLAEVADEAAEEIAQGSTPELDPGRM